MPTETVTLEKHIYGGECLGRLSDKRAVFVPYTLPGETVNIRLTEDKPRYARGELIKVIHSAPERIQPRCPHAHSPTETKDGVCGGCHYQHIPYQTQLQIKTDVLRDQLERIGKLSDPPIHPIVASPPWNYRNQVQFHLSPEGQPGYLVSGSSAVFPIHECHLPTETINEIWPLLDMESIPGLDRITLRSGLNDDLLILQSSDPQPVELELDLPLSVVHIGPGGLLVLAGDDHIIIEVQQRLFRVSAESYCHTNTHITEKMAVHLIENLPLTPQTTLIDAYCGTGLFSAFLAPHVGRLIGIDSSSSACEDFEINLDEYDHVALYEAPVEDVLPELDPNPEIIVVDPPRSGLARQTLDAILALGPDVLAYISSDPATLARDAKRLTTGGYQLQQITPFDRSPQTYHIESISFWGKI
ncbi:MAG: class I SAM-dependent RNA methyltransferase [Chloroflexi bacterium]|jgi:23S rRNA (uracil1939-C5)-methyltransferase|nr:class I SAM-dependent RNA methyltransferase [Chloroflexota bacterium]